jgi:hypothetical protein
MEFRTYRCDNCGKLRVNDETWWIVVSSERESFTVLPWGHHFPNNGNMTLCSQACIFQLLSEFLVKEKGAVAAAGNGKGVQHASI